MTYFFINIEFFYFLKFITFFSLKKVYDALVDQYITLKEKAKKYSNDEKKCNVLTKAAAKSKKYAIDGGQPGMPIFKAAKMFDPYYFAVIQPAFTEFLKDLPELEACRTEYPIYFAI